jgi:pimeloyl-ACP methyl ester carboxylesterase
LRQLGLSQGLIEYDDAGTGPAIVFVHGVWMGPSQWAPVVDHLKTQFRCLTPVLPLGAHRIPMQPGADLSLRGLAALVVELLDRLELEDVTLAFNDWCCAQLLAAGDAQERVGRLVLVSVETDDNYPPGLPGRLLALSARPPGGLAPPAHLLRFSWFRRLPMTFGRMSQRPIPAAVFDDWLRPAQQDRRIRGDLRRYLLATREGKAAMHAATSQLDRFRKPVLVAWGANDRVMPPASGRRLAAAFPKARFVEIPDSGTLVPLDQPGPLADAMRTFIGAPRTPTS